MGIDGAVIPPGNIEINTLSRAWSKREICGEISFTIPCGQGKHKILIPCAKDNPVFPKITTKDINAKTLRVRSAPSNSPATRHPRFTLDLTD